MENSAGLQNCISISVTQASSIKTGFRYFCQTALISLHAVPAVSKLHKFEEEKLIFTATCTLTTHSAWVCKVGPVLCDEEIPGSLMTQVTYLAGIYVSVAHSLISKAIHLSYDKTLMNRTARKN